MDGRYRTGDAGFMPAPDRLVVLRRADDMLNVGGVRIAPQPLEDRIKAIEGVADTVPVALPGHALIGETIPPCVQTFAVRITDNLPRAHRHRQDAARRSPQQAGGLLTGQPSHCRMYRPAS